MRFDQSLSSRLHEMFWVDLSLCNKMFFSTFSRRTPFFYRVSRVSRNSCPLLAGIQSIWPVELLIQPEIMSKDQLKRSGEMEWIPSGQSQGLDLVDNCDTVFTAAMFFYPHPKTISPFEEVGRVYSFICNFGKTHNEDNMGYFCTYGILLRRLDIILRHIQYLYLAHKVIVFTKGD